MVVCFVNIEGTVVHHCLNSLFIIRTIIVYLFDNYLALNISIST
jgi:hypothetical protein